MSKTDSEFGVIDPLFSTGSGQSIIHGLFSVEATTLVLTALNVLVVCQYSLISYMVAILLLQESSFMAFTCSMRLLVSLKSLEWRCCSRLVVGKMLQVA